MALRHDRAEAAHAPADGAPASVKMKRADGLDLEVAGSAAFVTATLERMLTALGIVTAPAPPA